jgi:DNA-binding NarL/FixJ family response regulator
MSGRDGGRTRVLVADADEARRRALCEDLGSEYAVAETSTAEETLVWLEDQAPGLTLLDHRLPGAGGAAIVARIRELFPQELVVILTPNLSPAMCRAAMRAGAYDCLERDEGLPDELRSTCDGAVARLEDAGRSRRAGDEQARAAVRRHEREAAGRLSRPESLAAWSSVDLDLRRRWAREYARAAEASSTEGDRERILGELAEEVEGLPRPGDVLTSLHVHAAGAKGIAADDAVDRARECLVRTLALVADRRMPPAPSGGPHASNRGAAPPVGRAWHRWRVGDRSEEWCLVVDGRPVARLSSVAEGSRGLVVSTDGSRLESVSLPPIPEALREVERRLGIPYVFTVHTAGTCVTRT